jgi:hypothetical protein
MNMLIIAGLMAIGLLGIVGAILLAMGEEKTTKSQPLNSQSKAMPATTTPLPPEKESGTQQRLPAIREDPQIAINGQFRELAAQLRVLHQQAQEIEHRLSLLAQAAAHIERNQPASISIEEEGEGYSLPEPVKSAAV